MKVVIRTILLLLLSANVYSQDLQKYIDNLKEIVDQIPTAIYQEENCDNLIQELNGLSKDINDVLEHIDDIHPEDVKNLKRARKYAEALENFLRTAGNTSYVAWTIKEGELDLVRELIDFSMAEVYPGKFCVKIYEIKLGSLICLLAYKNGGDDILNIKAQTLSNNGQSLTKIDMGLAPNQYRRLWSNEDKLALQSYRILNVQCTVVGKNVFGF